MPLIRNLMAGGLITTLIATAACTVEVETPSGTSGLRNAGGTAPLPVPVNPWLADSPWPVSHQNSYQQGSSPLPGPEAAHTPMGEPHRETGFVNITQAMAPVYPDGSRVAWGSNVTSIYKVRLSPDYQVLASVKKPEVGSISGAYTLVDRDGRFFAPTKRSIYRFEDEVPGQAASGIRLGARYDLPADILKTGKDEIVGINMTWDGWIAFATTTGTVGVLSRDFSRSHYLSLPGGEEEDVSNSIALDEDGGIYVVSTEKMYRVQWTGEQLTLDEEAGAWTAAYETGGDVLIPGRLGKGSGSTPSLMGTGPEDKFVVITDGRALTHLVLFWRDKIPADWQPIAPGKSRRIAAEVPVTFGDGNATQSMSEQSVLVNGYGAVVVNNDYNTKIAPELDLLADIWSYITVFRSNKPRVAPYGVEKFQWDPEARKLRTAWTNRSISCPNAIPTMSAASGLMYCVGQRRQVWNIEALDWQTGASRFHIPLQRNWPYTSFYAATQIGDGGSMVYGTFNGVVQLRF